MPPAMGTDIFHFQVAQSPIQSDLEHFQWWGIHNSSGQPVSVCHHHHCKKIPHIQSKSTLFQFKTISSCPVTTGLGKKSSSILPSSVSYKLSCKFTTSIMETTDRQVNISMLLQKTDLFHDINSDFFFMEVKQHSHVVIHLYIIILNTR